MKIAMVMPHSPWGDVSPALLRRGCGGRETAYLNLSLNWAKDGHEVHCFTTKDKPEHTEFHNTNGEISFLSLESAVPMLRGFPYDVIVSWEAAKIFSDRGVSAAQEDAIKICEMQVAHVKDAEYIPTCYWFALSDWHGKFLQLQGVKDEQIRILPNGVDIARYPRDLVRTDECTFVYSSSPDRGLVHLLDCWPEIYKRLESQDPELYIAYGIENWAGTVVWQHDILGDMAARILEGMKQPGVKYLGKVGQHELAEVQLKASMALYPCDTLAPTETGCITLIEACAAGAVPITTDCDCLGEEFNEVAVINSLPFNKNEYIESTLEIWQNRETRKHLVDKGRQFAESRDWGIISKEWIKVFQTLEPQPAFSRPELMVGGTI